MRHYVVRKHCVSLTLSGAALCVACTQPLRLTPDDSRTGLSRTSISAPNPGDRGPYTVRTLYYGSGTDKQKQRCCPYDDAFQPTPLRQAIAASLRGAVKHG